MKIVRYILGIILSLISIGLVILVIQETCEFDMAYLESSGFALIFASILFFVFILISVFKARKWQAITLIILSLIVGLFLIINVSFGSNELGEIVLFLILSIILLIYGFLILQELKQKTEINTNN
jgi:hypothetical protein